MNKGELIDAVATEMKVTRAEAAKAVEAVLESIREGLKQDEKVALSGFGTFQRRTRAARNGMNPVTKSPMKIGASVTCGFKPAQSLRDSL